MWSQPSWSNTVTAVLLLAIGILLGIIESSYALPIPFLLAAYLYFMMPASLKNRRFITMATLIIIAFGLIFGLSYLTTGLGGSNLALAEGVTIVALNTIVTALVVRTVLSRKATPQASKGQNNL